MSKKRAERRHHLNRMKDKARRLFRINQFPFLLDHPRIKEFEDRAIHAANHLAACSCWACGNPRKWQKERTFQEYRSDLDFKEFLDGQ